MLEDRINYPQFLLYLTYSKLPNFYCAIANTPAHRIHNSKAYPEYRKLAYTMYSYITIR